MALRNHFAKILLAAFISTLVACPSSKKGPASDDASNPTPPPSAPTLADEMQKSPFDISSIATPNVEVNPALDTPDGLEVLYPQEIIRPENTNVTTIERTVTIPAGAAGNYLVKFQNGNYGPFLARNCYLITDKNLRFQCNNDNLIETYEKSFTRMYKMNITVNGKKVGPATGNLLDTTRSYWEMPLPLVEGDNSVKFTYQGYESSFVLWKVEQYPAGNIAPTALFSINKMLSTTTSAFSLNAKDSFDSRGGVLTYEWNFGDSTPVQSILKPTHTYSSAGEYTISLKVTSAQNVSSTFSTVVLVKSPTPPPASTLKKPIAIMNYLIADPRNTLFLEFSAAGSNDPDGLVTRYQWDFGDKTTFEGLSAGHLFKKGGTYTVKLTVTDDSGLKTAISRLITVKEASEISLIGSVYQKQFTGSVTNPTKYMETFSIDPEKVGSLYRITIKNADGQDHIIKTCTGTSAQVLQCRYDNLIESSYIKLSRSTSAYVNINGVRVADSSFINQNKKIYTGYTHLQKNNQIQVTLYGYPTAYIDVDIEELSIGSETMAPEISGGLADGTLTNKPTMNVKAIDTSHTNTVVTYDGGGVLFTTAEQDFDMPLLEGIHTYTVTSTDSWGNRSTVDFKNINTDLTDPHIANMDYISEVYTKLMPGKTPKYVVSLTEPCKSLKVNGAAFTASADKMTYSGYVPFSEPGNIQLSFVITDLSGRITTEDQWYINVYHDSNPPVIGYQIQDKYLSTQASYLLPLQVVDDFPTNTIIKVNGVEQLQTGAQYFDAPLLLTREGANTVSISAKDLAGNASNTVNLTIVKDSKAPILTFVSPLSNAYVNGYEVPISVKSNENLVGAYINGVPLEPMTGTAWQTTITLAPGQEQIEFLGVDEASNATTKVLAVKPLHNALIPDLTSLTIDDQLKKILVKGAVGSTRPGLSVKISTGILSSTTVVADSKGSFSVLVPIAENIGISIYDPVLKQNFTNSLSATAAAETLIGGQVRDELDNPMPGASVSIVGTEMKVKTNTNGVFSFTRAKFPSAMVSGNQELTVDGSTVSKSFTGAGKKYGKVQIKANIGLARNNTLSTPVYLAPVYNDGTATKIVVNNGGAVQDVHAPGVRLDIPSNSTAFPSGKTSDLISVQTLPADRATIPAPEGIVPKNIVALEPSGTTFSEPVKLTLPNTSNLPKDADVIIMLMNSKTGRWEIGGAATVASDGGDIVTKPGQGIRHFSLAFATISAPYFKKIGAQDVPGADAFDGAMRTKVTLPSTMSLGNEVAPGLTYSSSWAAPTAVVTNIFDFPKTKTDIEPYTLVGYGEQVGTTTQTHCWDVITNVWRECRTMTFDYYNQFSFEQYFSNLQSSIQPQKVEMSVQVDSIKSDTKTYQNLPQRATMSFALPLYKDATNTSYLDSGLYSYYADYKFTLDQIIVGTKRERVNGATSIIGREAVSYSTIETTVPYEETNQVVYPQSLKGQLLVQNYSRSPAGTGWRIDGTQRIVNPLDSKIMIEESDGSVTTYSLQNTIDTVADLASLGADPGTGIAFNNLPNIAYVKDNKIYQYTVGSSTAGTLVATIPKVSGSVTTYDKYNFQQLVNHPYYDCINRWEFPGGNVCVEYGYRDQYLNDPFSHCSADSYNYSLQSKPTQLIYDNGFLVGVDANYHNFFTVWGTDYAKNDGDMLNISATLDYSNNYVQQKDNHDINFRSLCSSMGMNCTKTGTSVSNPTGYNSCPSYANTTNVKVPKKNGYWNTPSAIAPGPNPGTAVVANYGNNVVSLIDSSTGISIRNVVGTGALEDTYCPQGCPASTFALNHPKGAAVDLAGNYYVSSESGYIVKITPSGIASTIAGNNLNGNFALSDVARNMRLSAPYGLAVDNQRGYLYVADSGANRILRIDLASGYATTVAGTASAGSAGDGNAALDAQLNNPTLISLDGEGNLFILDSGNQKIRRVVFNSSQSGTLSYLATAGDNSKLVKSASGFQRKYRNGTIVNFDLSGKSTSISNRLGLSTNFAYNASGLISVITTPDGLQTQYNYSNGKLSSIVDSASRSTTFAYDAFGNLASVTFPDSSRKSFQYSNKGLLTKEINERNVPVVYSYNEFNRLEKVTDSEGKSVQINDIGSKNLAKDKQNPGANSPSSVGIDATQVNDSVTDANGNTTIIVKDINGYIATVVDPKGNKTEYHRDNFGRVDDIVKPNGSHIKTVYDNFTGDILKQEDVSAGIVDNYAYNSYGQQIYHSDGNGGVVTKTYSPQNGLLISEQRPNGYSISYVYNSRGQATSTTSSDGTNSTTTTNEYDSLGRLTKSFGADGKSVAFTYNSAGFLETETIGSSGETSTTTYSYDLGNRLVSVKSPKNELTQYEYLPTGELSKITNPKGKVSTFEYNVAGRLIRKKDFSGAVTEQAYDGNGNVVSEISPRGFTKNYSYNELNQMVKVTLPDDVIENVYDIDGNLSSTKNSNSALTFTRDSRNRITRVDSARASAQVPNHSLSYTFDKNDNKKSMQSYLGSISYGYDSMNRLNQLSNSWGDSFNFKYDQVNRLIEVRRPGSVSNFSYGSNTNLTNIVHSKLSDASTVSYFDYTYDSKSLLSQKRSPAGELNYSYDKNGQLSGSSGSQNEQFSYDSIGNRTADASNSYAYEPSTERLLEDSNYYYSYDLAGNLTAKTPKNPSSKAYQYIYSSKNQLVQANVLSSALGSVETRVTYQYDVLGRRILKKVENLPSGTSQSRHFMYDGDNILAEFDDSGNLIAKHTHSPLMPDDILSTSFESEAVSAGLTNGPTKIYYLKDQLGSITEIVNSSGSVLQSYEYGAFGNLVSIKDNTGVIVTANAPIKTYFMFTGRELDTEIDLYYYRARYYDPIIGRFIQEDAHPGDVKQPISINNKYAYASNMPTMMTDPSGNFGFLIALAWTAVGTGALSYIQAGGLSGNFNWDKFRRLWEINFAVSAVALITSGIISSGWSKFYSADVYSWNGFGVHVDGGSFAGGYSLGTTTANSAKNYSLGTLLHEVGHTLFEYAPAVGKYEGAGVLGYIAAGLTSFKLGDWGVRHKWVRWINPVTPIFEGVPDLLPYIGRQGAHGLHLYYP